MSTNADFDRHAAAWLAVGPAELSDRVLDAALREVHVTSQRRRLSLPWITARLSLPGRVAAALGVVVLASTLALSALRLGGFGGPDATTTPAPTAVPTPVPTPKPTPSPTPTRSPTTSPSPRIAGATIARDGLLLSPGVRYVLSDFEPAFTFTGTGLMFGIDGQSYAWFEHPESGDTAIGVVQPRMAFAEGGAVQPVPADLVAWLEGRGDLVVSSVTPITLGSVEGTLLVGSVPADAFQNAGGAINVLCPDASGCDFESGGSLGYAPGQHVLIVVTTVGGQPVAAMASVPERVWAAIRPDLEAFLRSFEFPA